MKKIFTLFAMLVMAFGAQAQTISFTADDVASGGALDGKTFGTGFVLSLVDENGKLSIESNKAYFGTADAYQQFEYRLKSGGKSSSKNAMTLTIPSDGTLSVYVRTGSNSATDRNLVLTQDDGTELYNAVVKEDDAVKVTIGEKETNVYPVISVAVKAGSVSVGYPTNSLNFYGFTFASTAGLQSVTNDAANENAPVYNLAGQRVNKNAKGVKIQNGKKFF